MSIDLKLEHDRKILQENFADWIIGVDEVGWGSFAGDIIICATAIPRQFYNFEHAWAKAHPLLSKVNDSKKVTKKKRVELSAFLKQKFRYGIGAGKVDVINNKNPIVAYEEAFHEAINAVVDNILTVDKGQEGTKYHILLDGDREVHSLKYSQQDLIPKGDEKSLAIAAASIIAKVHRDSLMVELGKQYPHYGWESNSGYGTPKHREALREHGACPLHRTQFIRSTLKK